MDQISPSEQLQKWRASCWPPKGTRQFGELPIWVGDHEAVAAFAQILGNVMAATSDHIFDVCGGRTPRWMAVPKIIFGVLRLNLVKSYAKASKRFQADELAKLVKKCGSFDSTDFTKLEEWFQSHPTGELVAHKPFIDLRAYVFIKNDKKPKRMRFYESGLVVAPPDSHEILIQDHTHTIRSKRSDAFASAIARSSRGWDIFPKGDTN